MSNKDVIKNGLSYLVLILDFLSLSKSAAGSLSPLSCLFMVLLALAQLVFFERKKDMDSETEKIGTIAFFAADFVILLSLFRKFVFNFLKFFLLFKWKELNTYLTYYPYADLRSACILVLVFVMTILFEKMVIEKKKDFWVWIISIITFVFCDLSVNRSEWIQNLVFFATLFHLMICGISSVNKKNRPILLLVLFVCANFAVLVEPYISEIQKPKVNSDADSDYSLFTSKNDTYNFDENASKSIGIIDYMLGSYLSSRDFDISNQEIVLKIKTTTPVDKIKAYNCGDYNMTSSSFDMEDDLNNTEGALYYKNAVFASEDKVKMTLTDVMEITDYTDNQFIYMPYTSFGIYNDFIQSYKDRYLYYGIGDKAVNYSYYYHPETVYGYYENEYLDYVDKTYLRVPEEMKETLIDVLDSWSISLEEKNKEELIYRIRGILRDNYTYSHILDNERIEDDPLLSFLTKTHIGYSNHFAGSEVLLYRLCGIPARYSYGYNITNYKGDTAYVLASNAYAYCEVFIENKWQLAENILVSESRPKIHFGPEITMVVEPVDDIKPEDVPKEEGPSLNLGPIKEDGNSTISRQPIDKSQSQTALLVHCEETIDYLKAYSCGDYDFQTQSFLREENIGNELEAAGLNSLEQEVQNLYYKEKDDNFKKLDVKITNAGMWVYMPYGKTELKNWYQDKNPYFEKEEDYVSYTLYYLKEESLPSAAYSLFVKEKYLTVDKNMRKQLEDYLISHGINCKDKDKNKLISRIKSLLMNDYSYTVSIQEIPEEKDPILYFLNESHEGYCQHFASAATLLFRVCDIPARYTVGYLGPFRSLKENEVNSLQAHSWVEIFTDEGWKKEEVSLGMDRDNDVSITRQVIETEYLFIDDEFAVSREWIYAGILFVGTIVIFVLRKKIVRFIQSIQPSRIQKINMSYLLLDKYHYVTTDIQKEMQRIRYSKEKESEQDEMYLKKEKKKVKNIFIVNHRYFKYVGFSADEIQMNLKMVLKNLKNRLFVTKKEEN